MVFPPHGRAFWTPLLDATIIGLMAYILGMVWTESRGIALGWAVIAMAPVWIVARVAWLRLIWRCYTEREDPPAPAAVVEEEDEEPARLQTFSKDRSHILVLDPPCRDLQLARWCSGMVKESPTTYAFWVNQEKEFTQEEYSQFREWLFRRGFADPINGSALRLTSEGMDLANWVVESGLRKYSPTANFTW
jgi:hypothetical protein